MKNEKIRNCTVFLILIISGPNFCLSQIKVENYINTKHDRIKTLTFVSGSTENSVRSINVEEKNPYHNLPVSSAGSGEFGSKKYELDKQEILTISEWSGIKEKAPIDRIDFSRKFYGTSSHYSTRTRNNLVLVYTFNLTYSEETEGSIFALSTLIVYDKKGSESLRLDHIPHVVNKPILSYNGRFVMFSTDVKDLYIYEMEKSILFFQDKMKLRGAGLLRDILHFSCFRNGRSEAFILDTINGSLYQYAYEKGFSIYGYNNFSHNGRKLTFNDLKRIK